ncbi:RNA-directed DNA polymerase from mobile element jockey-like [Brachionus plicatilis]|uniref:RNA-directed DNA polymerase from mobile element jockey-like n=1 Tax=Brachionus plicatilis TaxID=10195 RepID=A0A3M7RY53_BRAPC|nr:RNA-directed DNA polymerase from mobile element jockey-like [Brachionus plicatilis]
MPDNLKKNSISNIHYIDSTNYNSPYIVYYSLDIRHHNHRSDKKYFNLDPIFKKSLVPELFKRENDRSLLPILCEFSLAFKSSFNWELFVKNRDSRLFNEGAFLLSFPSTKYYRIVLLQIIISTEYEEKVKFLGITLDSKLTFSPMVDELKERCNSRLNLIKYLSNKKWGLKPKTLVNLYKSLIGPILDYSFPCLNSFSKTNIKKIQVIQNSAVRSILKLKYDTPSNIIHQEAFNKLNLLTISNRLFELSERYVRAGLTASRFVKDEPSQYEYVEYEKTSGFLPEYIRLFPGLK